MSKPKGKVAVVTGASKGMGAAIAKALAAEGAAVAVNYRSDKKGGDAVVAEITKAGGRAKAIGGDVAKKADVEKLFAEVKTGLGPVSVLVNNAGVYEFAPIEQATEESYRRLFDTNVLGTLLATHEALKDFTTEGGSIINLRSAVALTPSPASPVYSATNASVDATSRSLALHLGPRKIRVNSLAPGFTSTEGTRAVPVDNPSASDFAKTP